MKPRMTAAERAARLEEKLAKLRAQDQPEKAAKEPRTPKAAPTDTPKSPPLPPVPVVEWEGMYDWSWRDELVDEAFAHPAKAGRLLLKEIFKHLFQIGALKKGSICVDPFAGIFTTGIIGAWEGVNVIGVELEPKFVELSKENIALHEPKLKAMKLPVPIIIQGDSRKLREHLRSAVDAVVSSPPYSDQGIQGGDQGNLIGKGQRSDGRAVSNGIVGEGSYGESEGQLGTLSTGDVEAIVSSPPYSELGANIKGHGIKGAGVADDPNYGQADYGDTEGQLGKMKAEGTGVDAVVASPPYSKDALGNAGNLSEGPSGRPNTTGGASQPFNHYGETEGQLSQLKNGNVEAIVSSPPYISGGHHSEAWNLDDQTNDPEIRRRRVAEAKGIDPSDVGTFGAYHYGASEGQMGAMPKGDIDAIVSSPPRVDAVIASPPYSELGHGVKSGKVDESKWTTGTPGRKMGSSHHPDGYGDAPEQLGTMPAGEVDAVIASPPYTEEVVHGRPSKMTEGIFKGRTAKTGLGAYGDQPGQLGTLEPGTVDEIVSAEQTVMGQGFKPLDAIVSSPPYATGCAHTGGEDQKPEHIQGGKTGHVLESYGETNGNLAAMPEGSADAVVSSPPYNLPMSQDHPGTRGGARGTEPSEPGAFAKYGSTPGQIDGLPMGEVDAIVSSPPFADSLTAGNKTPDSERRQELATDAGHGKLGGGQLSNSNRYSFDPENLGNLPAGEVDAIVASPPYTGNVNLNTSDDHSRPDKGVGGDNKCYGEEKGQLSRLPVDSVDAIVSNAEDKNDKPFQGTNDGSNISPTTRQSDCGERVSSGVADSRANSERTISSATVSAVSDRQGILSEHFSDSQSHGGVENSEEIQSTSGRSGESTVSKDHQQNLLHSLQDKQSFSDSSSKSGSLRQQSGELRSSLPSMPQQVPQKFSDSVETVRLSPSSAGDTRKNADCIISSPPYCEIASGAGGLNTLPISKEGQQGGRSAEAPSQDTDQRYGDAEGQLAKLPKGEVDAIIASPPYADQPMNPGEKSRPEVKIARLIAEGKLEDAEVVRSNCSGAASNLRQQDYGQSDGQLGSMKAGDVDVVVSSPPYAETSLAGGGGIANRIRDTYDDPNKAWPPPGQNYGQAEGQLGTMKEAEGVDAVVSSPPYEDALSVKGGRQAAQAGIGNATAGADDPDTSSGSYGQTEGQLGEMKTEGVDAVVCSPPFGSGDSASAQSITKRTDKSATWIKANCGAAATEGYGETEGQMAEMAMPPNGVDAVVTSPPYEGSVNQSGGANDVDARLDRKEAAGVDISQAVNRGGPNSVLNQPQQYGSTEGQVGATTGDTFWSAARDIVRESYAILKPGGYAVWIVKAFVRDKQIVDFPGDWRKLCEYCGFDTLTEVHAMLVKESVEHGQIDLYGNPIEDTTERKSFFRRLAESKGAPRIDYEVVYIMRKP